MQTQKQIQGFTLLEILIAIAILALGIIALGKVQALLVTGENFAEQKAEAINLGNEKIEDLRNFTALTGYTSIASGNDNVVARNTTFTRTWTVTTNTDPNYKNVDIQVTWTSQVGINHSIDLYTIIAEIDPTTEPSGAAGIVRP